ncbi:hypothetical protein L6164_009005 [Bauhinia variegata]|uniref:Uncharacterized protein n=1 Tax=Bauhinia variegata TaxID=167791 RepID=A0ACB9PHN2_BAUVA|nr:hypothetical protein L6164_009005 [Bauhinia variegata]
MGWLAGRNDSSFCSSLLLGNSCGHKLDHSTWIIITHHFDIFFPNRRRIEPPTSLPLHNSGSRQLSNALQPYSASIAPPTYRTLPLLRNALLNIARVLDQSLLENPMHARDAQINKYVSLPPNALTQGGVGKSTFSAQLSFSLAAMGFQVGLLDIDVCGPSVPKMLGLEVVDAPPGTSDEHISIVQCLDAAGIDGAIVTTPQQVSLIDRFQVYEDVTEWAWEYMREKAPEMMNLIASSEVFDSSHGGAARMCNEMGVLFLGKVPLDPQLCKAAEEGRSCSVDKDCGVSAPALKEDYRKNDGNSRVVNCF